MHSPGLLAQKEKYTLSPNDFSTALDRIIFIAIHNLFENGAQNISVVDVDTYLDTNLASKTVFERENGIAYLTDAVEYSNPENFPFYYQRLKKLNAVKDLQKAGIDTNSIYNEDLIEKGAKETNERFELMSVSDIFDSVRDRLLTVESAYGAGDTSDTISADEGLAELIENLKLAPDIGASLQGRYFNTVCRGARKGKYYVRSAASGVGKSRSLVGDACHLAFPIRFNRELWQWEYNGNNERTLFIMTEQEFDEIQTLILAYLTEINEDKILYGNYSLAEEKVIKQALWVIEEFKDNLKLVQMPNPTVGKVQSVVRANVRLHDIQNVFFDYIFINSSLASEFSGGGFRNDEILLILSTALKDLAVELGIFLMTATQLSPKDTPDGEIKDERSIRGSKAIIDKADIGCIISYVTSEEKRAFEELEEAIDIPNQVLDIFKVRRGQYSRVRIWMKNDLGTCRREDLFMTDASLNVIENVERLNYQLDIKELNRFSAIVKSLNKKLDESNGL